MKSKNLLRKIARMEHRYHLLMDSLGEALGYPSWYYFADEREEIARDQERAWKLWNKIEKLRALE
jgi:hypothetical protein